MPQAIQINAGAALFAAGQRLRDINGVEPVWSGSPDAFVAKIDPAGNSLVYATYLGGPDRLDRGFDIAVDEQGSAYVAGRTQSPRFPLRNPFQRELRGEEDGFVAKLHPSGGSLVWSTYLGGRNNDDCQSIAVWNGSAYVAGETQSPDFPLEGAVDLILFGIGIRGRASLPSVFIRIGLNRIFGAQYAGPQPGLDQVNVRLFPVLAGSGEVDLEIVIDGQASTAPGLRSNKISPRRLSSRPASPPVAHTEKF